jgi:hypothetical protein
VSFDKNTKILSGEVHETNALADAVDAGFYPDCSIGARRRPIDGKMYLHHLAYLGEEPPAIKDLKKGIARPIEESVIDAVDSSAECVIFPPPTAKTLFLSDTPPENLRDKNKNANVSGADAPPNSGTHKEQTMTDEEMKAMQVENERLKAEASQKDKLLSDQFIARRTEEKAALKKAVEGKLTIPETDKLLTLADSFEQGKTITLSDSEGKESACSPIAVLTGIFSGLPLKVAPGELSLSDTGSKEKHSIVEASRLMMSAI